MKTIGNLSGGDVFRWGMLTALSLPFGFAVGKSPVATMDSDVLFVGKPVRGASMVVSGVLGGLGGFLLAYQQSSGRLMGYYANGR